MVGMHPRIGIAISTIGRTEDLRRLLSDLQEQTVRPWSVGVADQSDSNEVAEVCSAFADDLRIRITRGSRGLSAGRNAAVGALDPGSDLLWFPNDNSRVAPDFLASVADAWIPGTAAIVSVKDDHGERVPLEQSVVPIGSRSAWKGIIEAGLLIPTPEFVEVGGFDVRVGTGAETPWQAGEGTELLLRLRDRLELQRIPEISVVQPTPRRDLSKRQYRAKCRAYGRGAGYVKRMHGEPLLYKALSLIGGITLAVRDPGRFGVGDALATTLGRVEGLLGRTWGATITSPTASDKATEAP